MTASAFSLSALFPAASFAVSAEETAIGGLHGGSKHHFCAHCLTWAFTHPEGMDDFVNVRSPMLGASLLLEPFMNLHGRKIAVGSHACSLQFREVSAARRFSIDSRGLRRRKLDDRRSWRLARIVRSCELATQRGPCHDR
ncbi:hypothetical protein ACLNGM_14165 [Aureimonas phyllosphaerae]|uniref:hypothetical protein n=1 Tax=Aureimonas phyllosphaerae TaxID=1166078 RepID=UPI003A5C0A8B